jgi:hypothetical protein
MLKPARILDFHIREGVPKVGGVAAAQFTQEVMMSPRPVYLPRISYSSSGLRLMLGGTTWLVRLAHAAGSRPVLWPYTALPQAGSAPAPKPICIDEISIRKGHEYRIVVSDLVGGRPVWFGGQDRPAASLAHF